MPPLNISLNSPYLFGNKKTGFSVEIPSFGKETLPCPLMRFTRIADLPSTSKATGPDDKRILTTPKCQGCYAAVNLNMRPALRNRILNLPKPNNLELEKFKNDMVLLKALGFKRLRFFSFSDFTPDTLPFILACAKAGIEAHILSKTLTVSANEKSLLTLFGKKNIIVSLSFNKDWMKDFNRIKALVESKKPRNVQFNYTINPEKETGNIDWVKENFQVIHLKNKGKRKIADKHGIPETQTCGVFGEDGRRVESGGSCLACNNCNLSYVSFQKGKVASLPQILIRG